MVNQEVENLLIDRGTSGNCYPGNNVKIVWHKNEGNPLFISTLHGNYEYGSIVKNPNDKKYYSNKNIGYVQPQYEYKNSNHYCNNIRHGGYTKANVKHGSGKFHRSNKHHNENLFIYFIEFIHIMVYNAHNYLKIYIK